MLNIEQTISAIEYIETNLTEKLNLETIAGAINLSPYHLHRTFSRTVGLTINDYLRRRRLTEAAKMLIFSNKPILEISLLSGYESQQAFSRIFRLMYKYPPNIFRNNRSFYPLQLQFRFNGNFNLLDKKNGNIQWDITYARRNDIPEWMDLVQLVIDGYPFLDEYKYIQILRKYIDKDQAFIVKDGDIIVGNMLVSYNSGNIDFLGIHPLYRTTDLLEALLNKAISELRYVKKEISITTYRADDKADTGYRRAFKQFGFTESALLTEFGYPTQKFLFHQEN